jgi:hypothetical protein
MQTVKVIFRGLSNRRLGSDFTLAPGENHVPVKVWDTWKSHKDIAHLVASKVIETEEVKPAETAPAPANTGENQNTPTGGSLLGRNRS